MANPVITTGAGISILLIDRQKTWRDRSARALQARGYTAIAVGGYKYPPPGTYRDRQPPDLVVLGCASVGPVEQDLVKRILARQHPLVVLCSLLTSSMMRTLFLAGAKDVAIKPYDEVGLVAIVSHWIDEPAPLAASGR